jgi:short-subunit dehydrogenase
LYRGQKRSILKIKKICKIKLTAIITGSGRGIGKETAIMLVDKVENTVVYSRTRSEITEVTEHIKKIKNEINILGKKM